MSEFDVAAFRREILTDPLVRDVWDRKYRLRFVDGSSTENSVDDTRARVVRAIYANDPNMGERTLAYQLVRDGLLVPAGRVNAGAGADRAVTLGNCYVSGTVPDSMPGIQRAIAEAALTLQQGGGIGTDFSTIRPAGALVKNTGSVSSGVIPFMDQQNAMSETIISMGDRRGAMMATLSIDHPDIWNERHLETHTDFYGREVLSNPSFISAKRQRGRLTQFNVSILVTNDFMKAVDEDQMWDLGFHIPRADGKHVDVYPKAFPYDQWLVFNDLTSAEGSVKKGTLLPWYVYRRVRAKQLWEEILRSTYTYAEPGVFFVDRVNGRNNLVYCEDIRCCNPCGEQPLPPYGMCALASVNLAFMVERPFTTSAAINYPRYAQTIACGVRFLDNLLDVTKYPLHQQKTEAMNKRRIGLGVTGFADLLLQLGVRYGSAESVALAEKLSRELQLNSYMTSMDLARERGAYPLWDADEFNYSNVEWNPYLAGSVRTHGLRNGVLNTIAPNGTISVYVGNVSSGHEPHFSFGKTERRVRQADGTAKSYTSIPYGLRLWEAVLNHNSIDPKTKLPDHFVGAMEITPSEHVAVHCAWQKHIDAAISKTINCPTEMTFEDFAHVYSEAYDNGAKGCTTYRYDRAAGRGFVLAETGQGETKEPDGVDRVVVSAEPAKPAQAPLAVLPRPDVLDGRTYKVKWPITGVNWYINVTNDGTELRELFITGGDASHHEWVSALAMTVTAILRRGGDLRFLTNAMSQVPAATGGAFIDQRYRPSIVACIAGIIEREIGRLTGKPSSEEPIVDHELGWSATPMTVHEQCPACKQMMFVREAGCKKCLGCGHEACG